MNRNVTTPDGGPPADTSTEWHSEGCDRWLFGLGDGHLRRLPGQPAGQHQQVHDPDAQLARAEDQRLGVQLRQQVDIDGRADHWQENVAPRAEVFIAMAKKVGDHRKVDERERGERAELMNEVDVATSRKIAANPITPHNAMLKTGVLNRSDSQPNARSGRTRSRPIA
ncbi:MAG: hypothetical protein QOF31_1930 [Mycobacterium sp.]|nr:hypothetical protein [Mycobacterium sp.]